MRIVFMGTPDFAVASLDILVKNNFEIVGVVTSPDRRAGRGLKVNESAVKRYAKSQNLPILQPTNLKSQQFIDELKALQADLQIVVAFRMLPKVVWDMPELGTFNLHASLLPQYRGAAPINWAIINGEKTTGVTTFFLQHEIDTGNIIKQQSVPISDKETAGALHDELMNVGSDLVLETVKAIEERNYTLTPQDASKPIKHAPKIFKEDCEVNWDQDVNDVYNFIRGLSPYPTAWTKLRNKQLKIYLVGKEVTAHAQAPGTFISDLKSYLKVAVLNGFIKLEVIQLEGKKHMKVQDFLRGNNVKFEK